MTKQTLVAHCLRMLTIIRAYRREHGYPPTINELGRMMGIDSKSRICEIRSALARAGLVTFVEHRARSLKLTPKGHEILRAELAAVKEAQSA